MRLEYLHLEKFGIFDGLRLDLSDQNVRLNIIYGPNEAGKSTVLAAIADLLFGMGHSTPYNFLYPYDSLRIGAMITNTAGQNLEFRRRKTRVKDLIGPTSNNELPDNSLVPFLGGLDRGTFERMFGLNHKRLRDGGKAMLEASGEISRSLFEAGSGGLGLGKIIQSLSTDANAIGSPGSKVASRPYWRAHERYEQAQSVMKANVLRADVWAAAFTAQIEATKRRDSLNLELSESRTKRSGLERVRRVAPLLRRIDDIIEELNGLGQTLDLPEDFDRQWQQALTAHTTALDNLARERDKLRVATDELAALGDTGPWPTLADRVEKLMTGLGDYRAKCNDRPNRLRDISTLTSQLANLVRQLGSSEKPEIVIASKPPEPAVAKVRSLVADWVRLDQALKSGRDEVTKAENNLLRLEAEGQEIGQPSNPLEPRAALEPSGAIGDTTARLAHLRLEHSGAEQELLQAMATLGRCNMSPEALSAAPFPTADVIAEFERQFARLDGDRQAFETDLHAYRAETRRLEGELETLSAGGEVPTSDALKSARNRRDRNWHLIRRKYIEGGLVPDDAISEFAADGELALAFEGNLVAADVLADRREREAARVERFSTLKGQLLTASNNIAATQTELKEVQDRLTEVEAQWKCVWEGTSVTIGAPMEMHGWATRKDTALTKRSALARVTRDLRAAEDEEKRVRSGLFAAARLLGIVIAPDLDTASLRARVRATLEAADEAWSAFQENRRAIATAKHAHEERKRELAKNVSLLESWKVRWESEMPGLGLPASTTTVEAEAALTVWQRISVLETELGLTRRRLEQIDDAIGAYENEVAALVSDLGSSIHDLDIPDNVSQLVPILLGRQTKMAQLAVRLDEARNNVRRAESSSQTASNSVKDAARDLRQLREEHNIPEEADVIALTKQSARQRSLLGLLASERVALAGQGDGYDEGALRAEVSCVDADAAAAEVDRLETEIGRLQAELLTAAGAASDADKSLSAMSEREGVGTAAQQANEAAAEMLDCAERWLRLTAASSILNKAVERYRASNQHPLIKRASEIFVTMAATGDDPIIQLSVNYDEEARPVLEGIRRHGKPCKVSGMSEGTADQLFLALRIAAIELYIQGTGPIPFIADDLFITSDDERTIPGILALAELGRQTQVLLFTHHRYVVEAANKALSPEHLKVHHLPGSRMQTGSSTEITPMH